MKYVKDYSFYDINKLLFGKNVQFVSDCEFFPNFNVICKIKDIHIKGNETLFEVTTKSNKHLTIGSNMKNLRFKLLN